MMKRPEPAVTLPFIVPYDEGAPLVDHGRDLRPLTDLVIPLETRQALDRVLAENYQASALAAKGLRPANRLLFCGPPGCGKTVAAGALALALGIPLASVRLDAITSSFMGKTAANLRHVFDLAKSQRVVLFLDEVDALGREREDQGGATDAGEAKRIVNSLLVMLEEIQGPSLVVAATNHEGALDSAIWRRFDDVVVFPRPTALESEALLWRLVQHHDTRLCTKLSPVNLRGWGNSILKGFSFADVERVALDAVKATVLDETLGIEQALVAAVERQKARRALTTKARRK